MVLSLCCCDLHIFRRQCVNAHVWELLANQKWGKGRPADVHPCVFNASSWSIQHGIAASAPLQRDGSINGSPNGPECNVAPATPTINDRDGYCAHVVTFFSYAHQNIFAMSSQLVSSSWPKAFWETTLGHQRKSRLCSFIWLSIQYTLECYYSRGV